ncbi:major facilitator superfamily domain-containing protein [Cristinia sonorae]|uniref:Major facilitator superfamily domain-containing protein n=1 Tax=Cristinia sonorae TaxID=1940300 RepID=A0A8K0UTN8_9AGAR|nr:major facilitator superfamily domain-containing protein [Cristinia sonorae]
MLDAIRLRNTRNEMDMRSRKGKILRRAATHQIKASRPLNKQRISSSSVKVRVRLFNENPVLAMGRNTRLVFVKERVRSVDGRCGGLSESAALPTIINELHGDDFVWVGSGYALASTAVLPLTGGLAQSMTWLIAGRVVQNLGGGGLLTLSNIIVSDLVPLVERGKCQGIIGLTWSLFSALGPLVGGALATGGNWRWFFCCAFGRLSSSSDLNLPINGVALTLAFLFLRLPTNSAREDGSHGLDIPWSLLQNRTSVSGYIQTFINPVAVVAVVYYLPPIGSSVDFLSVALIMAPMVVSGGVSVAVLQRYRPQIWISWCLFIIGMGCFTVVHADTPKAVIIGLSAPLSVGAGIVYGTLEIYVTSSQTSNHTLPAVYVCLLFQIISMRQL